MVGRWEGEGKGTFAADALPQLVGEFRLRGVGLEVVDVDASNCEKWNEGETRILRRDVLETSAAAVCDGRGEGGVCRALLFGWRVDEGFSVRGLFPGGLLVLQ